MGFHDQANTHPSERHDAAALALWGKQYGFVHADVRMLRGIATRGNVETTPDFEDRLHDLADRLLALLPPEELVKEPPAPLALVS